MRLTLTWRDRDVVDVELHAWRKRPPTPPKDEGPILRASGHLSSSERGRSMRPDTVAFGFGRRR